MEKGKSYKLISFNGTIQPFEECDPKEDYWTLIGQEVIIVGSAEEYDFFDLERVLVKFHIDVQSKGLECHNAIPNTLWIDKNDLIPV